MRLEACSATDIGLVRKSNQDAAGCFPELSLFVVADGMGGHTDGEVASRMAVEAIHEFWRRPLSEASPDGSRLGLRRFLRRAPDPAGDVDAGDAAMERLEQAVRLANTRVFAAAKQRPDFVEGRSMGTTVVVLACALDRRRAYWAHVGDSRLYRVRDRELALLTADHTLSGQVYRDRREIPTDVRHTNALMQAVGLHETVEVSTAADGLRPGDLFLLCSDGLSGMVPAPAIHAHLMSNATLEVACRGLIDLALRGGGKDNATVVLVRVAEA